MFQGPRLVKSALLLVVTFGLGIAALAVQAQQKNGQVSSRAMKLTPQD